MDKRFLEDCLAKGMSLSQIGKLANRDPSTVGYWVKRHGLVANGAAKYAPRGQIAEETLMVAVDEGLTLQEMADELKCSVSTIRHWLKRYGLSTVNKRRPRRRTSDGARVAVFECPVHGWTRFVLEGRGYYRCKLCRQANVVAWRRRAKRTLVREAGGKCQICGYNRCIAALEFHHLDPSTKSFPLSTRGCTRSIELLRAEAAKCVLLCANCHAEVENGVAEVPLSHVVTETPPTGLEPVRRH